MPLTEFPLYLVPIAGVEVRLDSGDGLAICITARGGFVLDIHGERSTGVEAMEGGRADGLWGKMISSVGNLYIKETPHGRTNHDRNL